MTQRSTPGCVLVAQSCPTLYDPMDCSPPGSSVHGISLEMEWVAFPFSRGSSWHRDWTWASLQADSLPSEPPGKPLLLGVYMQKKGNTNLKRYMHQIFIIALFIIAKTWKQPMCIYVCVCVYMCIYTKEYYYSVIWKTEILPFSPTWMNLKNIILSEVRQQKTDSVWYHLYLECKNTTN